MSDRKWKSLKETLPPEALEHMKAAREEMKKSIQTILPPGFMEHRRTARKEMLMAFRSMIDAALEKTEEKNETA